MEYLIVSESKQSKTVLTSKEQLLELVSPKTLGCLWVGAQPFESKEKPFSWFDYLFNGSLENHLYQGTSGPKNFFSTPQYGGLFFLGHIEQNYPSADKAYEEFLSLMKSPTDTKEVLLISSVPQLFGSQFFKKKKEYDFVNLLY
jgi:hypothetical protein